MIDFTFLTIEQVSQLDILKKDDKERDITDFSILLGEPTSAEYREGRYRTTGWWWTKTPYDIDNFYITQGGLSLIVCANVIERNRGARPAVSYSSISSSTSNPVRGKNGIIEVEYGEYPQTVVSEDFARTLEKAYSDKSINQTGKSYTTDSVSHKDTNTPFRARTHIEYEYNGKKYIRIISDYNSMGEVLSDRRRIKVGDVYWVEVEPIKWLIDERANIAISKKILFSGVRFDNKRIFKRHNGDFSQTNIKKFMDKYFSKEIATKKVDQDELNPKKVDQEIYTLQDSIEQLKKQIEILPDSEQQKILNQIENVIDHGLEIYQTEKKIYYCRTF